MQASDLARSNALALLARHARTKPTAVAFRSKHLGIYRERTWRDYAGLVARAAAGLKRLGVTRGERVAIMGDPCEEWMLADLGAQAVGAISYGIYPTASASEVEYQLRDAGASVFVAQDQEYVDRILPFADRLPALRFIVVVDTSAMFSYEHPKIRGWSAGLGEASAGDDELAALEALAAAIAPGDPAFIVYTSGTTGPRAPWSRTAGIWPAPTTWCSTIRSWPSRSAPWSTCRSATCWDATSR
jgi:long-chain acyl-CoA synthetase